MARNVKAKKVNSPSSEAPKVQEVKVEAPKLNKIELGKSESGVPTFWNPADFMLFIASCSAETASKYCEVVELMASQSTLFSVSGVDEGSIDSAIEAAEERAKNIALGIESPKLKVLKLENVDKLANSSDELEEKLSKLVSLSHGAKLGMIFTGTTVPEFLSGKCKLIGVGSSSTNYSLKVLGHSAMKDLAEGEAFPSWEVSKITF